MQAFRFIAAQKPAELREVAVPEPGPGQVRSPENRVEQRKAR